MDGTTRKRILLVDDDSKLGSSLKRLFELEGLDLQIEDSGRAALTKAMEQRPDLVILDLKLPDMHGYQVCRELRKSYHSWVVPVVMLTGMHEPVDQLRGFAYGADAYLTKPCQPAELLKTVRVLLGEMTPA